MSTDPRNPGTGPTRPLFKVKAGTMIGDKYRVEGELGRGGFGVVVRAIHLALDEKVAIKILTESTAGDEAWQEDAARFRREAQAAATLKSEHVVRILDVDVMEGGLPYIVMEYLEGETLHHIVHTRGPLSFEEAVDHLSHVLSALAEAHAAGIIHRDLKPANVFVTKGKGGLPVTKVLDFGASKTSTTSDAAGAPLTRTGAVIGTVAYMAPEQIADAKRVDARADIWSAGMLLYEMLSKVGPFGNPDDPTHVTALLTKPPIPLSAVRPDVPPRLEAAVMKCLHKTPERRFDSVKDLGRAIAPFATPRAHAALEVMRRAGPPSGAASHRLSRASAQAQTRRSRRRRMAILLPVLALAFGLLVGVVGGAVFVWNKAPAPAPSSSAASPARSK